nr:MAG TPA: hypothetical protein [Caudoviricetes sp.]
MRKKVAVAELSADHNDTIQGVGEYPKWYFPTLFFAFFSKVFINKFFSGVE